MGNWECSVDLDRIADEEDVSGHVWVIGLCLAVGGCALSALGLSAQRYAHVKNTHSDQDKVACKQPWNVFGIILMGVGAVMDLVAFGFAPQSLLAPLGAVTLVLNTVTAPLILKERLTKLDIVATVLVFAGVVLAIVFGSRATPKYHYDDLVCLYLRLPFEIYASLVTASLLALMICLWFWGREHQVHEVEQWKFKLVRLFYPCVSGVFGGGSVLFGKSFIELLKSTFEGYDGFEHYAGPYFITCLTIVCLLLQVRILNLSLKMFEALFVVPVYQAFWVLINVLGGCIYFDEVRHYTVSQWVLYPLGIAIMLSGVLLLSQRTSESEKKVLQVAALKRYNSMGMTPPASPTVKNSPKTILNPHPGPRVVEVDIDDEDERASEGKKLIDNKKLFV